MCATQQMQPYEECSDTKNEKRINANEQLSSIENVCSDVGSLWLKSANANNWF